MVARKHQGTIATECATDCPFRARSQTTAHWIIAILLTVVATCLVIRMVDGTSWLPEAKAQTARLGAHGIFAFTGQLGARTYGLFMVDVDAGNVWCYEYMPEKSKLRLVAGRSFLYDRYLEEFNTESPTPAEVAQLVDRMRAHKAREAGATRPTKTGQAD